MGGVWRRAAAAGCIRIAAYVLTDNDDVHAWFDELPLRRHPLTVTQILLRLVDTCCYSGMVCTMWQIAYCSRNLDCVARNSYPS